jgi:hypothetical protein
MNTTTRKMRRRTRPAVMAFRARKMTADAEKTHDMAKCLPWIFDDGGRFAAGWPDNDAGDCVTRAIAIATGQPYRNVWQTVCQAKVQGKDTKRNADAAPI